MPLRPPLGATSLINRIRRTYVGVPVGNADSVGVAVLPNDVVVLDFGVAKGQKIVQTVPVTAPTKDVTADTTLTSADNGKTIIFADASGNIVTIPSAVDCKGCVFTFYTKVVATSLVHSVSPAAADGIGGGVSALTTVINKDLQNDTGSDAVGDTITIQSTGVAGTGAWVVTAFSGAYAKEA
jgi:hypothetical protein